jgi:histidine ammonia-lyase
LGAARADPGRSGSAGAERGLTTRPGPTPPSSGAPVTITAAPLVIEEVVEVARGATVELGSDARALIQASRAVVDRALDSGAAVYGLNTGVGHMKDVRLPDAALRSTQELLVASHAGGIGAPLPTEIVRAAIAVRLNGIARGGSGASPAAAETLAAMLNAGVHPIVPETGSIGAGDLPLMACIALVAIGRGRAEVGGEVVDGAEALRRAGIAPLELAPKDGLTLMSANGVSIGRGALLVAQAAAVARAADVVAALSLEAIRGNPSFTAAVVAEAKPFPGQIEACRNMRAALAGSPLHEPGVPRSIQDPLSFRVAPQVHGALHELVAYTRRAVEIELNALSDNPLVSIADGTMVSNGNFHPVVLALAFDALRGAVAHVGQLSERRMGQLWDTFFARIANLGPGPPPDAVPELVGLSLRYPAAAVFTELKQLAAPATLDAPPLDIGVEDHATSAPLSVRKTDTALGLLEDILSIELFLARDVLTTYPAAKLGLGTAAALRTVERAMAEAGTDRSPASVHRRLRERLLDEIPAAVAASV